MAKILRRCGRPALMGGHRLVRRTLAWMIAAASCLMCLAGQESIAQSQAPMPNAAAAPVLPEPIYWRQHLFLIPYQWGSAAEPGAAQMVSLFVSKDRGVSWQKISDAKPQVKAFNYRAEGDGEYWFAVRTLDIRGRLSPEGPYQPELRVVVDTTLPRIDELRARVVENGAVEIQCRATDVNLDPATLKLESQIDATGAWQPIAPQQAVPAANAFVAGLISNPVPLLQTRWQPPVGIRPATMRATISDRAGNAAVYQTQIVTGQVVAGPSLSQPALSNGAPPSTVAAMQAGGGLPNNNAPPSLPTASAPPGWVSSTAGAAQPPGTPITQPWPAGAMARAPFRLWTSGSSPQDDGVTAYGSPPVVAKPPLGRELGAERQAIGGAGATEADVTRIQAHYAGVVKSDDGAAATAPVATQAGPQFAPLEPFRQASIAVPPALVGHEPLVPVRQLNSQNNQNVTPIDSPPPTHRPPTQPKVVGSRTFALEYDLDDAGRWGVSKVELWGTRDGGQSWNRYAQDDDNRSPLVVTVDDEGLYGFRILVQNANGVAVDSPRAGEEPELWVSVDLKRPIVELTAIERGEGNLTDHLILRWRAQDNNLEPRPISLFFSSRPGGPWSAIATNLEDTGQYAWRVERYVPTRFYLRVEARDIAGNLAAFQTREAMEFAAPQLTGRLRSAAPVGAKPVSGGDSYR